MAVDRRLYGVDDRQERAPQEFLRDTRSPLERFFSLFQHKHTTAPVLLALAAASVVPVLTHLALLLIPIVALIGFSLRETLPFRMPQGYGKTDYGDRKPGGRGYHKARGTYYLGVRIDDRAQLWLTFGDFLTHLLVVGTTGAGKTETLVSLSANIIAMGGGLIYIDAKASPKLLWQISSLARAFGREDDVLVINYMTGGRNSQTGTHKRMSNTSNPLANGTASALTEIFTSMISEPSGDNAVFGERAISLLSAIMYGLVDLRDKGHILLNVSTIREYMVLEKVEELAAHPELSEDARVIVEAYLKTLPGYGQDDADSRSEMARQHGYGQHYFTRALSSLSDTYGHIYKTELGEVDFRDVVLNRRILVVLLPALEKSMPELKNLGKIILAALKTAISVGLGDQIEGDREDVLDNLPTNAEVPAQIICDEYAYICVEGFAITAAQARGLGFGMTYGLQTMDALYEENKRECMEVWDNTKVKFLGTVTGAGTETFRLFEALAGEAYVTETSGFSGEGGSYRDRREASVQRRKRIDVQDLKVQTEGETHLFWKEKIVRAAVFYANPPIVKNFVVNRFLKVRPPERDQLPSDDPQVRAVTRYLEWAANLVAQGKWNPSTPAVPARLAPIVETYANPKIQKLPATMQGIHAFMAFKRAFHPEAVEQELNEYGRRRRRRGRGVRMEAESPEPAAIRTEASEQPPRGPASDPSEDFLGDLSPEATAWMADADSEADFTESLAAIEQAAGVPADKAQELAERTRRSLREATRYPTPPPPPNTSEARESVNRALANLRRARKLNEV